MDTETRLLQPGENGELVEARTDEKPAYFIRPSFPVRVVNRLYGWITGIGFGRPNSYLLQVSGRKTGKIRSVPVNVLSYNGTLFLVATRDTRNGRVTLWPTATSLSRGADCERSLGCGR